MADRIACINPNCRRTAARERYPHSTYIICAKCWKALPQRMRQRHKQLNARSRTLTRLVAKPKYAHEMRPAQWQRLERGDDALWDRLNAAMVHFFTVGEVPLGLDEFLQENGIA